MFSLSVVDTDWFLDLPLSTQALYFHLNMRADDDGFVDAPNSIVRKIGASKNDFDLLLAKRYILQFDSGIIVIKHWRMHNSIRQDRIKHTQFQDELKQLRIKENGSYTDNFEGLSTKCQPNGNQMTTNGSQNGVLDIDIDLGLDIDIDKKEIYKENLGETSSLDVTLKPKKHKYGSYGWIQLTDLQYNKLVEEFTKDKLDNYINALDEYVQSTGNKNKYKDWNLVLRKAIRENWFKLETNSQEVKVGNKNVKVKNYQHASDEIVWNKL